MNSALALPTPVAFPPLRREKARAVSRPAPTDPHAVAVERQLVRAALDGDGKAFESLVKPHLSVLYRISVRACSDSALAEDAVQEALTKAFEQLRRYQPGTSFRAFLAAIAVQRAKTLLRSERRRRAREEASEAPPSAANPRQLVEAQRTAVRVREALEAMPPKRRSAAMLRLDAGLSYAEIAQALGSTEGSTRVLVHLALKELKARLADVMEADAKGSASR